MCEALDRIEKRGMEKGRAEGMEKGRREGMEKGRREGMEKGKEYTRLTDIRSLMETLKLSAQQAMDALKIPAAEQPKYAAML